ncbi:MAG: type II toxin-antitoxin system death-on-curing family toxin [Clostridia bacterium]|nr:type II toxin-antitoxin system death-on-curing family toxin [Clostridia bacterium]
MIKLSKNKVMELHELLIKETGGSDGLRDSALLESALESAYATFDGFDLYPTIEEKAAKLTFSLINNHAFVDGNKRIGIFVLMIFLEVNDILLDVSNKDLETLGLSLAASNFSQSDLVDWIFDHKKR